MSAAIPMPPVLPMSKTAVPAGQAQGKGEQDSPADFTTLLSGKRPDANGNDGPRVEGGAGKWPARQHGPWRMPAVMASLDRAGPDEAADEDAAIVEAKETDAPPQVAQVVQAAVPAIEILRTVAAAAGAARAGAASSAAPPSDGEAAPAVPKRTGLREQAIHQPFRHAATAAGSGGDDVAVTPGPHVDATVVQAGRGDGSITSRDGPREQATRSPVEQPAGDRAPKLTVVSVQTAPAPAGTSVMTPTSASFVEALGGADALPRYVSETAAQTSASQAGKPVTTLKIQLNPVDLGTVTASLSGDGEKLSIEVQVENQEAHHRLRSDGDAIVKALRGMGFDVDRITIQQTLQSAASPGSPGSPADRGQSFAAPDQRAGEGRGQSPQGGTRQGHDERVAQGSNGERGEAGSGGVYI